MTHYSIGDSILFILLLLIVPVAVDAQPVRTPEQQEFVDVLGTRIRSASQAEVTTLTRQQLDPVVAVEQRTEVTWRTLAEQVLILRNQIDCLNDLIRDYPRIRGNMDPVAVQQVNNLRRQSAQRTQQLTALNAQLSAAATAFNDARARRLAAERIVASKNAANLQLISDFSYLFRMWQLNPPRYTWEAMMARLIEVGNEKKLTANVTVSTGNVPVTVRYQRVGASQSTPVSGCTRCNIRLPVGNYNFWVERPGTPEPQTQSYLIFREAHSIDLSRPS